MSNVSQKNSKLIFFWLTLSVLPSITGEQNLVLRGWNYKKLFNNHEKVTKKRKELWNTIFDYAQKSYFLLVLLILSPVTNLNITPSSVVRSYSSTLFLVFQVSIRGWKSKFNFKSQKFVFKEKKHKWPFFSIFTPTFTVFMYVGQSYSL